jgi:hypothetical protein
MCIPYVYDVDLTVIVVQHASVIVVRRPSVIVVSVIVVCRPSVIIVRRPSVIRIRFRFKSSLFVLFCVALTFLCHYINCILLYPMFASMTYYFIISKKQFCDSPVSFYCIRNSCPLSLTWYFVLWSVANNENWNDGARVRLLKSIIRFLNCSVQDGLATETLSTPPFQCWMQLSFFEAEVSGPPSCPNIERSAFVEFAFQFTWKQKHEATCRLSISTSAPGPRTTMFSTNKMHPNILSKSRRKHPNSTQHHPRKNQEYAYNIQPRPRDPQPHVAPPNHILRPRSRYPVFVIWNPICS